MLLCGQGAWESGGSGRHVQATIGSNRGSVVGMQPGRLILTMNTPRYLYSVNRKELAPSLMASWMSAAFWTICTAKKNRWEAGGSSCACHGGRRVAAVTWPGDMAGVGRR